MKTTHSKDVRAGCFVNIEKAEIKFNDDIVLYLVKVMIEWGHRLSCFYILGRSFCLFCYGFERIHQTSLVTTSVVISSCLPFGRGCWIRTMNYRCIDFVGRRLEVHFGHFGENVNAPLFGIAETAAPLFERFNFWCPLEFKIQTDLSLVDQIRFESCRPI